MDEFNQIAKEIPNINKVGTKLLELAEFGNQKLIGEESLLQSVKKDWVVFKEAIKTMGDRIMDIQDDKIYTLTSF